MSRFACSVLASRPGHNRHTGFVVEAANRYEADGLALAIAYKLYPPRDGWYQHNVVSSPADPPATPESIQIVSVA